MKTRKTEMTTGVRVLFGCVGFAMLATLVHGVSVGVFNMHEEPFRRTDHPFGFWLYAAFLAGIGLTALYGATFGNARKSKH